MSKNLSKNRKDNKQYIPDMEGVYLCLDNSERLYKDATLINLSYQTQFALLELSLEELMKAWMLFIVIAKKNYIPKIKENFKNMAIINDFYEKIKKNIDIDNLEKIIAPFFDKSFYDHKIKIKYLKQLLTYISDVLNFISENPNFIKETTKQINIETKKINDKEIEKLKKYKDEFKLLCENIEDIINKKNLALYVYKDNDLGTLLSPSAEFYNVKLINELYLVFNALLKHLVVFFKLLLKNDMPSLVFYISNFFI